MADGQERKVMVAAGGLAFDRDGEIVEQSPARESVAKAIATRLVRHGGAALIIDYGHARSAPGDTLQALRGHAFAPILANPGEQDLTSHVDFEALARAAEAAGARVTALATQGEWLNSLGIGARAAALATANPKRADELASAVHRLVARDAMGSLFKVMAVHSPDWPTPAGFGQ
jgi:SAM-dependent MidA family methyltransferase